MSAISHFPPRWGGITGRDGYIIEKALAYAINTIDGLPFRQQEGSDRDDMMAILETLLPHPTQFGEAMESACSHMGRDHVVGPDDSPLV